MERRYKIPSWHELYSDYFRYLENSKKTLEILTKFRKKHDIKCELMSAGTNERTGQPYLCIGTHKDYKRIAADKKKFGTALLKPNRDGLYGLRKNGTLYRDWLETLKNEDNFKVLDEPRISKYIAIDNKGKDLGEFEREFSVVDKDLFVTIRSDQKFMVTDDFIEVETFEEEDDI